MPNTNIDQEQIVTMLQQSLAQKSAWSDLLTTSTGQTLIEFIATSATFAIFANERGLQEAFPDTARLQSSVLSAMRQLGVRISRKLPASTTVKISKSADGIAITIPAYSVFTGRGKKLYNNSPIIFSSSEIEKEVVLYEGLSKSVYTTGTGASFQTFVSIEDKFTVADSDVRVTLNGLPIPVVTEGLWRYKAQVTAEGSNYEVVPTHAVKDATTKNGELELMFGSTNYGTTPGSAEPLVISYCLCLGSLGNDLTYTGAEITVTGYPALTCVALAPLTGGADEKDSDVYRRIGPNEFAALDRAVNDSEYNAVAASYPGVVDAQVFGQRRLAPTKLEYMNLLRISLLTTTPWSITQRNDFEAWYRQRSMGHMRFFWSTPISRNYTVDAVIYCDSTSNLSEVEMKVRAALTQFTTPSIGFLGRTVYKSEIYDTMKDAHPGIKYTRMKYPNYDVVTKSQPPDISTVELELGTIPAGPVYYYVSSIVTVDGVDGESLPLEVVHTATGPNKQVRLEWDPVQGVDKIRIYAIRDGNLGMLGEVHALIGAFVDSGAAVDEAVQPSKEDTISVMYPKCSSVNLRFEYADDRGSGVQ